VRSLAAVSLLVTSSVWPVLAHGQDGGVDGPRLTRGPAVLVAAQPRYPPAALAAARSADVTLHLDLDPEGRVTHAEVVRAAGAGFDQAALEAAQAMQFSPAEVDGRPSAIRIEYVLHFRPPPAREEATGRAPGPGAAPGRIPAPPMAEPPSHVRGQIRERGTRAPIAGADVLVVRGGTSELVGETDAEGRFELRMAIPSGGLRLLVQDTLHQPCVRDLTPADREIACLAALREGPRYETVLAAPVRRPEQPRQVLSQAESRSVPGTMGDPLRAVQSLPGVARSPYGLGLLVIRGASPANSGVFIDGLQVPALYHFLVGPSVLNPPFIEQIDFFPGGFGVRYGRLTAGAVDVTARRGPAARPAGAVELSPLDGSLFFESPLSPRTSVTAAVRRSAIDFILPSLIPERPGSSFITAVPSYWDYQGRIDHRLGGGGTLSLFALGSNDDLQIVSADPNRRIEIENHVSFHRAQITWAASLGRWTSRLQPAYGYGEESFRRGQDQGYIRYHRLYLRHEVSREPSTTGHLGLILGFDGILSRDTADFRIAFPREGRTFGAIKPEQTVARRSLNDIVPALWVETPWQPMDNLRLVPGVRFDSYFVFDVRRASFDPRLAVHWAFAPRTSLRAGAGLFHQLGEPRYLDPEFGNPRLSLVRAEQYHLGLEHQLGEAVRASATVFALWRWGIPVPSAERFSSLGRARSRGIEVLLRHVLRRRFYGWLAYTLSHAEQSTEFAQEIESGLASPRGASQNLGTGSWRPSTFDQTHNLILVGSYRRGGWELGARYRLVSGTPTSPVAGAFFDLDFDAFTAERGPAYSARQATFSQLDLRVERTFTFDLFLVGVFVDVQNALNSENPEDIAYDYRYRQSAPVRGLPILPLLGVRGRF
jgi:TonB family protein